MFEAMDYLNDIHEGASHTLFDDCVLFAIEEFQRRFGIGHARDLAPEEYRAPDDCSELEWWAYWHWQPEPGAIEP